MNFKNLHFVVIIPTRDDDSGRAPSISQPVAGLALSGMDYPLLAAIPRTQQKDFQCDSNWTFDLLTVIGADIVDL